MCSYNRFNGVYACENPSMLHGVLDSEFGFSGLVMSDWVATHSTVASANAGMDMEMPGGVSNNPEYYGPALKTAVQAGQVSTATLNEMVHRILFTMFRIGLFDHVPAEGSPGRGHDAPRPPRSLATATTASPRRARVLLKNAGAVLPLDRPGQADRA